MFHSPKHELVTQLFFPSKTIIFVISFSFQWLLKFQNLQHCRLKKFEITSLDPIHWRLFKNTKSEPKLIHNFQFWYKWIFNEKIVKFSITSPLLVKTLWNQQLGSIMIVDPNLYENYLDYHYNLLCPIIKGQSLVT